MDLESYIHKKWTTVFKFLDVGRDGLFTMAEWMEFPSKLLKTGKVDVGIRLAKAYKEHWDRVFKAVNRKPGLLTIGQEDWVKGHTIVSESQWFLDEFVPAVATAYFDSMDRNQDDRISIDEWRQYYQQQGSPEEEFVQISFAKMDENGDGYITRDEYERAIKIFNSRHDPGNDYSFLFDSC